MRTVVTHFFNEEYLLPWWLRHHLQLFDHGILINHGSTDSSCDVIRNIAPDWLLVNSTLPYFNAYMTDFEVMQYERGISGWKVALTVSEFLISEIPLQKIEAMIDARKMEGFSCTGFIAVDNDPSKPPSNTKSLLIQKAWGFNENEVVENPKTAQRWALGGPYHNRFYHRSEVGMYQPGRHRSFHPHSSNRLSNVMVLHFGYSPWTAEFKRRKMQIGARLDPRDVQRGLGKHHLWDIEVLEAQYARALSVSVNLMNVPKFRNSVTTN